MKNLITALLLIIALVGCHPPLESGGGGARKLGLGTQTAAIALAAGSNNDVAIRGSRGNTTTMLQFTVNASGSTMTGMDAATISDGDLFFIRNNSSAGNLTLTNADALSLAANRFLLPGAASLVIPPRGGATVEYDATLGWTVLAPHGAPLLSGATLVSGDLTLGGTGKVRTSGSAIPVLSNCGASSITAGSTDVAGKITTGAVTTCTLTFSSTWTTAPSCILTPEGNLNHPTYTTSATAITATVTVASTVYNYVCVGR